MSGYKDLVRKAYVQHRGNAKQRGIPFLLTYEEWCVIWMESGKWDQRGLRRGQYVMARPGDQGAYEVGNVVICLAEENRAERNRKYKLTGERHHWHGKNNWLAMSEASKASRIRSITAAAANYRRNDRGRFIAKASTDV